jgi:Tol biopolymer transport system component
MTARLVPIALVAGLMAGPAASATEAFYGNGATIVSASMARQEQGDSASNFGAISQDGRYVAFETRASNFFDDADPDPPGEFRSGGIFRRDLQTGALEKVADGDFRDENDPNTIILQGAHNPSISADGRYIVFSTAQKLAPEDTNDAIDVYVRDMTLAPDAAGAYTLVSEKDGGTTPATYASPSSPRPGRNPGSDVWPGGAISADGRKVVFSSVEVNSDLPDRTTTSTPGFQVFVRDLDAHTTRLVTHTIGNPATPAGGSNGPAAISGDGSTVVWTAFNAPAQTKFFNGEPQSSFFNYYLWQRVADGPSAPTRRVTGAVDPDDPACPPDATVTPSQTATGPCYGPLTESEGSRVDVGNQLPGLSNDGRRVAFVVSAAPRGLTNQPTGLEAWVTDMSPGVSRKAGSRELTRSAVNGDQRTSAAIEGVSISPDGRWVALSTNRVEWILPGLAPIGTFRTTPTQRDIDVVDLDGNTIQRVTRSYTGGDTNGRSSSQPSLSEDGSRIAFSSEASNLFFGDANEAADIFVTDRTAEPEAPEPPPPDTSSPPTVIDQTPKTGPVIRVKAARRADGSVRLTIRVPAPGKLSASARGRVATKASKRKPPLRVVAKGSVHAPKAGAATLTLRLGARYRRQLRRVKSVSASTRVLFVPDAGGKTLARNVRVTFSLRRPSKR